MAERKPPYAALALSLVVEDWKQLGLSTDPAIAATDDLEVLIDRVTALLLVRAAAVVAPLGTYPDLSTAGICRNVLSKQRDWPQELDDGVIGQLKEFVGRMLKGYKPAAEVPYHSVEHAYHVVLSTTKLVDMMIAEKKAPTYGLRNDGILLMAQIFAALIHDVEHQGIPNRQLSQEKDRLAVLYNDQSIAENWSLYVAFSEFLQDEFGPLRKVLFPDEDVYLRFRKAVINLVLATDIASPERTQIGKSKWKEAFGDPFETVERKMRAELRRASLTGVQIRARAPRRGTGESGFSELSVEMPSREHNDDDSLSDTPENSEHEQGVGELLGSQHRKASMGSTRQSSLDRRMSSASRMTSASARVRLGILRTVDLSGETLEAYSRAGSIGHSTTVSSDHGYAIDPDADEPDELKSTVIMETIMTAADVAHNLQGFEQMKKWSSRLYLELRKAYQAGRGFDASAKWFENQIGFLESYLLPLAHRLEDTNVFGSMEFARIVEDSRDRWLTEGYDEAQRVIAEGAKVYPVAEK